jgi:hypothetical protein
MHPGEFPYYLPVFMAQSDDSHIAIRMPDIREYPLSRKNVRTSLDPAYRAKLLPWL